MIVIAGTVPIKTERWDDAKALVAKMVAASVKEAGCISYQFHTAATAEHTFFLFEEWESEGALAAHFQTEHLQNFMKEAPNLLDGPIDAKKYTVEKSEPLAV